MWHSLSRLVSLVAPPLRPEYVVMALPYADPCHHDGCSVTRSAGPRQSPC